MKTKTMSALLRAVLLAAGLQTSGLTDVTD